MNQSSTSGLTEGAKASGRLRAGLSYRKFLEEEFQSRKDANPRYSLRAYSRDLGVSAASLSHILRNRHSLSVRLASVVAEKLKLGDEDARIFRTLVESESGRSPKLRDEAKKKLSGLNQRYRLLKEDAFRLISDWHHLAILELLKTEGFHGKCSEISQKLGITETEALFAVERLERLGMVKRNKASAWVPTGDCFVNRGSTPSAAVREFHAQILDRAKASIHDTVSEDREHGVLIQAIDPARLPELKQKLQAVLDEIDTEILSSHSRLKKVYCISMQLFPLTY